MIRSALEKCLSIDDLRALAKRNLPAPLFDYLEGGAETEATARRNLEAFDDRRLVPHCLVDVTNVDTRTRLLGQAVDWPVLCSPTGASRFYHPDGELAVARATAGTGTLYGLSTMATASLEEVAAAATGPRMFQLYVFKDRELTTEMIQRSRTAGYGAICLTVDAAVRGKRERELRSGMGVPLNLSWPAMAQFAMSPMWLLRRLRQPPLSLANFADRAGPGLARQTRFVGQQLDASVTWADVRQFTDQWRGPFAIKGIMAADDARRAVDAGATAIIISNHGGRQLDGAASPFDVLPDIARAVGGQVELILDGGIRRGVQVLKAMALGATGCSIGRPYLYGLAAGGEAGVSAALRILKSEFHAALALSGCASIAQIEPELLR
jgi:L-lactate dehydrogenase (cytochrome)